MMSVAGLVFALLFFVMKGVCASLYDYKRSEETQSRAYGYAFDLAAVSACMSVFCIVFDAASRLVS